MKLKNIQKRYNTKVGFTYVLRQIKLEMKAVFENRGLRTRPEITSAFSISSSSRLCPFLNRGILIPRLRSGQAPAHYAWRFRSIDHGQIQPEAERITSESISRRVLIRWVLAMSVMVGLTSCSVPKLNENPRIATLTSQLDKIDTVRLEEHSRTQPVTIAEATTELVEEITEPNQAIATVELTLEEVRAAALANNLDLKVTLVDPAIAQQTLDAERAKFEAALGASMRHRRASDTDSSSRINSYNVRVDQPLATGGVKLL